MFFLASLLLLRLPALAQKEGNIWYVGPEGDGLDFNTAPPTFLRDGGMRASVWEPVVMADPCGNLLFYSDGFSVWNRAHQIMANGGELRGGYAIQPAVAVPHPKEDSVYFLFTQTQTGNNPVPQAQLHYSVIDLRLDGGMGGVTVKNEFLYQTNGSYLTSIRHANGHDYWVVTAEGRTNRFLAYLIGDRGLERAPVVSSIAHQIIDLRRLRASPDGRLIALSTVPSQNSSQMTLLRFDPSSGQAAEAIIIPFFQGAFSGMDFSPDSRKLYFNTLQGVWQLDLGTLSGERIVASRYDIPAATQRSAIWDLRVAPDGKLYIVRNTPTRGTIDVIDNPNEAGPRLRYRSAVYRTGVGSLPNNLAGLVLGKQKGLRAVGACAREPVQFSPQLNFRVRSWQWDFGDPASGAANSSAQPAPAHTFSAPGTYRVRLVTVDRCGERDTVEKEIAVYPEPVAALPERRVERCYSEVPVRFATAQQPLTQYRWSSGQTTPAIEASRTGWYTVTASNPCGTARDSVYLDVTPRATAYMPTDTIVCEGTFAVLDARNPGASYRWSTGHTTRTVQVDRPGKYTVEIRNRCSAVVDTVTLVFIREDVSAFIPNVFTPNGDGYNDAFEMQVLRTPAYSLRIFNRWGSPVFFSKDPATHWDGRLAGGREAAEGVYFWLVTATDCRGQPVSFKGTVTLLR